MILNPNMTGWEKEGDSFELGSGQIIRYFTSVSDRAGFVQVTFSFHTICGGVNVLSQLKKVLIGIYQTLHLWYLVFGHRGFIFILPDFDS